jgi:hypothetical protein
MMPKFVPVSRQQHAAKRWLRPKNFSFAAHEMLIPLMAAEVPSVAVRYPIVFVERQETLFPAALLGLLPGKNLFVGGDGRWLADYVPALIRAYPFALVTAEADRRVLCFAEDSGLMSEDSDGEPFFADQGDEPPAELAKIIEFLQQIELRRAAAAHACACLKKHGLLQPGILTIKTPEKEHQVPGLLRLDEAALAALSGDALHELQQAGALPLAYAHLLSMQHLSALAQRAEAAEKTTQSGRRGDVPVALDNNGTISFPV